MCCTPTPISSPPEGVEWGSCNVLQRFATFKLVFIVYLLPFGHGRQPRCEGCHERADNRGEMDPIPPA
jgi:hypothetical protein